MVGDQTMSFLSEAWFKKVWDNAQNENVIPPLPQMTEEEVYQQMKINNGYCHYPSERLGAPYTPRTEYTALYVTVSLGSAIGKGLEDQVYAIAFKNEIRFYFAVNIITGRGAGIQLDYGEIYNLENWEQLENGFTISGSSSVSVYNAWGAEGGIGYLGQNSKNEPIWTWFAGPGVGVGVMAGPNVNVKFKRTSIGEMI